MVVVEWTWEVVNSNNFLVFIAETCIHISQMLNNVFFEYFVKPVE
jgi:hypothetical protein